MNMDSSFNVQISPSGYNTSRAACNKSIQLISLYLYGNELNFILQTNFGWEHLPLMKVK